MNYMNYMSYMNYMNYRDYRKFNSNNFQYELHVKIVNDDNAFYNYGRFEAILCDVNIHL